MAYVHKKLATGTCVKAWVYDDSNYKGLTVGVKNKNDDYQPVLHIESVVCAEGTVNRIELKKSDLEALGFITIIE